MESGAKAAISGFRKQALFTLDLILRDVDEELTFQPEGEEDLAILKEGRLIRAVQVKALSSPLTLSHLGTPFFSRVSQLDESVNIEVASFGKLGPELEGVRSGEPRHINAVTNKLVKDHGLKTERADSLAKSISLSLLDEFKISKRVTESLGGTVTAGNPERAFELLIWWIHKAAEKKEKITLSALRDRLQAIGRYLTERKAKYEEWFTTIKPLEDQAVPNAQQRLELAHQYYQGAAARYSHICADLDVRREELLAEIDKKFSTGNKVVILHGASGQGKTSLALRYLHDFVPSEWRFLVTAINDRQHAASVANALADHLHTVNVPVYLLLDVAPIDKDWVALIREFRDTPNVRILVTIREEDLARQRTSDAELGFPADIALEFTAKEAESLYDRLLERGDAKNAFPSFIDAWERFGGEGPLLEFVYLITQTESLRMVLFQQVLRLRDDVQAGTLPGEALQLLQICAVATAFEARLLVRPLAEHLDLSDPSGVLRKFEKEYLLRESADKQTVEALHPFRSVLLAQILEDPAFTPRNELILKALSFIPESDLGVFLLYVFSRSSEEDSHRFQEALLQRSPSTWAGAASVGRALLWKGLRHYRSENQEIFDQAVALVGSSAAELFLISDIAGVSEEDHSKSMTQLLHQFDSEVVEQIDSLREQLSPLDQIYQDLKDWIRCCDIKGPPRSELDWSGYADLLLWSGKLETSISWVPSEEDGVPFDDLTLDLIAELMAALYEAHPETYSRLLRSSEDYLRERFRRETQTLVIRESNEDLEIHFVVPMALEEEGHRPELFGNTTQVDVPAHESPHDRAIYRATTLRMLFPGYGRFCTWGHGHQITHTAGGFELPHDESHKEMKAEVLALPGLLQANSNFRALGEYSRRPQSWSDFADQLLELRGTVAEIFFGLRRNLLRYFERSSPRSIIEGKLSPAKWDNARLASTELPLLPVSAVDEWGLSSETVSKNYQDSFISRSSITVSSLFSLRRHEKFQKAARDYFHSVKCFLDQAWPVCLCHGQWGRQIHQKGKIISMFEEHGYGDDKIRLSKFNLFALMHQLDAMQKEFDSHLGGLVDAQQLDRTRRRESQVFPELWALWYQLCHHPEKKFTAAGIESLSTMERARDELLRILETSLANCPSEWTAKVLSQEATWRDETALVVQLEVHEAAKLEDARIGILELLDESMGQLEMSSLQQYTLEYYWSHVIVIPTWKGEPMEDGAWIIPASLLKACSERSWLRPLQQVPHDWIVDFGFEATLDGGLEPLGEVQKLLSRASSIYAYIANFKELLPDLDDLGHEVLITSLDHPLQELKKSFVRLHDLLPAAIVQAREICAESPELEALFTESFEKLFEWLDEANGGKIDISVWDAPEEAAWFGQCSGHATVLRWIAIAGSIDATFGKSILEEIKQPEK